MVTDDALVWSLPRDHWQSIFKRSPASGKANSTRGRFRSDGRTNIPHARP